MDVEVKDSTSHADLKDKTRLRSEIVQEVISRKAGGLERYSLLLFLLVLACLLVAAMFINYPDIIESRVKLTAANAPKEIVPHAEGRLIKLFIHNDEIVEQGQQIGWIESLASHAAVVKLSQKIDTSIALLKAGHITECSSVFNENTDDLGELQQAYQEFLLSWQQFNDYMVNGFYSRKHQYLQQDIRSLQKMKGTILSQLMLYQKDLKLSDETYTMNKTLNDDKVISNEEFRTASSKSISKQLAIPQLDGSLIGNETQQRGLVKELDQLEHDKSRQKLLFEQALQSLRSSVDNWEKKYILTSPVSGKVFFVSSIQENQSLHAERMIGFVSPSNTQYFAETYLPQDNFGKVDTGLKAQLRFDAYPYMEYGSVHGEVSYISKLAYDSGFLTTIKLDSVLMTDNRKIIPYKNGLQAQAIIITRDMSLLERLYYDITMSLTLKN
jgi:HlyD family secretion protein